MTGGFSEIFLTLCSALLSVVIYYLRKLTDELHALKLDYSVNKSITECGLKQTLKNEIKIEDLKSSMEDTRLRVHSLEGAEKSLLQLINMFDEDLKTIKGKIK